MNERIRELAEQAWDHLIDEMGDVVSEDGRLNSDFLHAYVQRFAELIVQECLNQCYYRGMNDELYVGQLKAAAYIEQHFGVEE